MREIMRIINRVINLKRLKCPLRNHILAWIVAKLSKAGSIKYFVIPIVNRATTTKEKNGSVFAF